jgi:peptidoglycan/xylan/chitin deacetylase (PgdA/CDA1 family)
MAPTVPILLYHHVSPDREITPEAFEAQLLFLLGAGFQALSLDELATRLAGGEPLPAKAFAVTFDDGYLDNWVYAYPILRRLEVPATIFLITDRVENHKKPRPLDSLSDTKTHERDPGGFLSWAEVREMQKSGLVSFGSHTRTHRGFVRRERFRDLGDELRGSKARIEKETGRPCRHLAWPWGDYARSWLGLVRACGYQTAHTTRAGANTIGSDLLQLKRLSVRGGSTGWLQSRLRWNRQAWLAQLVGPLYGLDRRMKVWWKSESPY